MRSQEIYLISWLKKIQGKIPFLFLRTYTGVLNSFHELGKKTAFCLATTTEIKCAGTGEIRHLMHYSFQDPVLLLVPPARGNDRHWNDTSRKPVLLVSDCFGLWMYLSTVDYSICFDRASLLRVIVPVCKRQTSTHSMHSVSPPYVCDAANSRVEVFIGLYRFLPSQTPGLVQLSDSL